MFTKKKSLAKIATLRSKRAVSESKAMGGADGDDDGGGGTTATTTEQESSSDSGNPLSMSLQEKRPSWNRNIGGGDRASPSFDGFLLLPGELARRNSASTPDLNSGEGRTTGDSEGPPPPTRRRSRPMSRNHSLKYSGGALHGAQPSADFDHNFEGGGGGGMSTSSSSAAAAARRSFADKEDELRKTLLQKSLDLGNESTTANFKPRRTQSVRIPPMVRLLTEDGEEGEAQSDDDCGWNEEDEDGASSSTSRATRRRSSPSARTDLRKGRQRRTGTRSTSRSNSPSLPVGISLAHSAMCLATNGDISSNSVTSDDDEEDEEAAYFAAQRRSNLVYGTPPANQLALSPGSAGRKGGASAVKSRSMISLNSNSDQLNQSFSGVITADQARTRSFLHGAIGATSLLGPQELEKCFGPERALRVFVGTWNMNGNAPPRHLADFLLPRDLDYVPDILVVGTQESFPERNEWEVRLQDTLGPSHVLFHSASLGVLHQAVFLRRDLVWYCSVPETDYCNVRPGTQLRTKGAVATAFLLFGTSFLFVNSHLTAHQENSRDRIKDYKKICVSLNLPKLLPSRSAKHKDIDDKFDCVFWAGDLNFRLEQTREVVIREVRDGISVLDFDQLNFLREEGLIFKNFAEAKIAFPPTYKYDVGTNKFDTSSKQRTPSYTDRILFRSHKSTRVENLCYDSVQAVKTSDHKPVWGIWEVRVRPGRDTIPLAGGLFNRDVYLEGLKRRAEALQPVLARNGSAIGGGGHHNMCSVQ